VKIPLFSGAKINKKLIQTKEFRKILSIYSELFEGFTPNFFRVLLRTFQDFHSELFEDFTPNFSRLSLRFFLLFYSELFKGFTPNFLRSLLNFNKFYSVIPTKKSLPLAKGSLQQAAVKTAA